MSRILQLVLLNYHSHIYASFPPVADGYMRPSRRNGVAIPPSLNRKIKKNTDYIGRARLLLDIWCECHGNAITCMNFDIYMAQTYIHEMSHIFELSSTYVSKKSAMMCSGSYDPPLPILSDIFPRPVTPCHTSRGVARRCAPASSSININMPR